MAKLPDIQPNESIHIDANSPHGSPQPARVTLLGEGIHAFSSGFEHLAHGISEGDTIDWRSKKLLQEQAKRDKLQADDIEVSTKYSDLRKQWSERLLQYQDDPQENQLAQATKEYDDYHQGLIKSASNPEVARELGQKSSAFRNEFLLHAHTIQVNTNRSNFAAAFDRMYSNAEDTISTVKTVDELNAQKSLLRKTLLDAYSNGRLKDKATIEGLDERVNQLSSSWAVSNVATNPHGVMNALDTDLMKGVSAINKETIRHKAQTVIDQNEAQDKYLLHESLQADKVNRMMTGEGNSLNLDSYEKTYGKSARDKAEYELNLATKLHTVIESAKGATTLSLQNLLEASKPKSNPTSITYAMDQEFSDNVQRIVSQAAVDKKNDAYTYFLSNPAIKPHYDDLVKNNTPQNAKLVQFLNLEAQKMDKSLDPYDYKVMPKDQAEQFINRFNGMTAIGNKEDGAGVQDVLSKFLDEFKDTQSIALNQLNRMPGGSKVTPKLNPLLWHLNNPSMFRLVLDAIRKNPDEEMARFQNPKERTNFLKDASLDPNLMKWTASILSTGSSEEGARLAGGVKDAFTAFSRDWALNGGKMKDASQAFFGPYSFGEHNGGIYARPMTWTDDLGKTHVMTKAQTEDSNLNITFAARSMKPESIDPNSILNETKYFSPDEIKKDVTSALSKNVFWSTTEDETGLYLFTKGSLTGAPRQVKHKDGSAVRLNFKDTLEPFYSPSKFDIGVPTAP